MKKFAAILFLSLSLWAPAVLAEEITVHVRGMVCGFCAQGINKKFSSQPGVANVKVSLEEKTVRLTTKKGESVPDEKIRQILKDSGYDVDGIERTP